MNYLIALTIFMIFHGSFSVPIKWSSPIIHGNLIGTNKRFFGVYVLANSDTLVIAFNSLSEKPDIISYNRVLNNGTLTAPKFLDMNISSSIFYGMDSKIADDRKHIMLVYTSQSSESIFVQNIHFRESFDEGDTWSPYLDVKRPNEDENQRTAPSVAIEESTGKIALFYVQNTEQRLNIRDSGTKNFKEIYNGIIDKTIRTSCIKFTYDRENSIRYIHLFHTIPSGSHLYFHYLRSADQGKTWNKTILVKSNGLDLYGPIVLMNETIAKGVIYIEYVTDKGLQFIFTKNHGETWEGPIILGSVSSLGFASAFCGKRGKGRIFATMPQVYGGKTIYFNIDDNKLRVSDYPLNNIHIAGVQAMDCTYDEKQGKYTLALISVDGFLKTFFSKGIMFDK